MNYGKGEEKRISLSGEAYDMNKQTIYRVGQKSKLLDNSPNVKYSIILRTVQDLKESW